MGREEGGLEAVPEADTVGATGAPCLQSPGRAACGVLTWLGLVLVSSPRCGAWDAGPGTLGLVWRVGVHWGPREGCEQRRGRASARCRKTPE